MGRSSSYAIRERERAQALVAERYGREQLDRARAELCTRCSHTLLPLTTEGAPCPYFQRASYG